MPETANVNFGATPTAQGGSPKAMYIIYLLQQCGYHQKIMSTNEEKIYNIERSCLSLISWCPDEEAQDMLFKLYQNKKAEYKALDGSEESAVVSATIIAESAARAEVIAKTALILGPEEGMQFIKNQPGARGIMVLNNGALLRSEASMEAENVR